MNRQFKAALVMTTLVAATLLGATPVGGAPTDAPAVAGDRWCC